MDEDAAAKVEVREGVFTTEIAVAASFPDNCELSIVHCELSGKIK